MGNILMTDEIDDLLKHFLENFPNSITNAIDYFDDEIECCGQDSYEIIIATFGKDYSLKQLRAATDADIQAFAKHMKKILELDEEPSLDSVEKIISQALRQCVGD